MLITVNGVNVRPADTGDYKVAEVSYNREGKDEVKKLVSFGSGKDAFTAMAALKNFPVSVNVTLKKEGKYWNWTGAEVQGTGAAPAADKPAGRVVGSNFETTEERARRQVYIVRQSSITAALDFMKHNNGKAAIGADDVINVARVFEGYVFEQPEPVVK